MNGDYCGDASFCDCRRYAEERERQRQADERAARDRAQDLSDELVTLPIG